MSTKWYFSNDKPIYSQIVEQMKKKIVSGEFEPGDKIATVRDLASEAEVNPNTMQRALSELEQTGLLHSQRTAGRFVTEDLSLIQNIKNELANEIIEEFLKSMNQIGYSNAQIIDLIRVYEEV